MPILYSEASFERLSDETIAAWRAIPPAIASDCMNRAQIMASAIKPLAAGMRLCGQARTVQCMVGDNSAIHAATRLIKPGEVLIITAGGHRNTALWGGLLTQEAQGLGLTGVVVDGAVRDIAEICDQGFACFAAAGTPAGPHKGFGGTIDGVIACAGCTVAPGDLILGDDDGVAVVPLARQAAILAAARAKLAEEDKMLARLKAGESLADQLDVPQPEKAR